MNAINEKNISALYGLLKDHKPTWSLRLINPLNTSIVAGAKTVITRSLENLFLKYNIHQRFTIQNAQSLVQQIYDKPANGKILISIDIQSMYPSITQNLVEEALLWYAEQFDFSDQDLTTLTRIIDILTNTSNAKFGHFSGKFYTFSREGQTGLTMGDYDSAFLADAYMNFIYCRLHESGVFGAETELYSYRDDTLVIREDLGQEENERWIARIIGRCRHSLT